MWPTPTTNAADRERWLAGLTGRAIAYIEQAWAARMAAASIYRYEFPADTFEAVRDVGMWAARSRVAPARTVLAAPLAHADAELQA